MAQAPHWRVLSPDELPRVDAIAALVHPQLPERSEVLAEKLALFPIGCFAFVCGGIMQGYALAHPWRLFDAPALDSFLYAIPGDADCLFLHDVALLPQARGHGAVILLMRRLHELAQSQNLPFISCMSVYGTEKMWARHGFKKSSDLNKSEILLAYGPGAAYMTCPTSLAAAM